MGDVVITYETLYEISRREKNRPELQKLDITFFKDSLNYLSEKKRILDSQSKQESLFAQSEASKTKKQLENVHKILRDIYEKRERKLMEMAVFASRTDESTIDLSNMLPEEIELFKSFVKVLNHYRSNILINLLSFRAPQLPTNGFGINIAKNEEPKEINTSPEVQSEHKYKKVKIINPLPSFIGTDLKVYGPYNENDTALLPEEVVELLLKKLKATLNENT